MHDIIEQLEAKRAAARLGGGAKRIADANGRVSFPVARGRHVLLIEADGYPPSEAVVVV